MPAFPAPDTSTAVHPERVSDTRHTGRVVAAGILRHALADTCGGPALARAVDVSPSTVKAWVDTERALSMALGDVVAARDAQPAFVLRVAELLVATVEPATLSGAVDLASEQRKLARDVGSYADELDKALDDGRVDDAEAARLDRFLATLDARITKARAHLAARRSP